MKRKLNVKRISILINLIHHLSLRLYCHEGDKKLFCQMCPNPNKISTQKIKLQEYCEIETGKDNDDLFYNKPKVDWEKIAMRIVNDLESKIDDEGNWINSGL